MKRKKYKVTAVKVWVIGLIAFILIVGVPFLINESYKVGKGYVTVWTGAEFLSYYGTIIGAASTITALVFTISFTRKQILYGKYVQSEMDKWRKIEELFDTVLELAQPMNYPAMYIAALLNQSIENCSEFTENIYRLFTTLDRIKGTIDEKDEAKVQLLLVRMYELTEAISPLANDYSLLIFDAVKVKNKSSGSELSKQVLNKQKRLEHTAEILREQKYLPIIQLKKKCFTEIYAEIDQDASQIIRIVK